jgi:hypothetical protein
MKKLTFFFVGITTLSKVFARETDKLKADNIFKMSFNGLMDKKDCDGTGTDCFFVIKQD